MKKNKKGRRRRRRRRRRTRRRRKNNPGRFISDALVVRPHKHSDLRSNRTGSVIQFLSTESVSGTECVWD
jgi:hypothetical protein